MTRPVMMEGAKLWLAIAAASGFVAVAAGAFGAHALEGRVGERELAAFETGARYQMYHALALLAVAWLAAQAAGPGSGAVSVAGWSFVAGTVLFSGSLYLYGATGSRALVLLTPVGGIGFLLGWGGLFVAALRLWRGGSG